MKLLELSLVFFFLLELQCARGASLAGKLQEDWQETEDTEGERELEDEDMTNGETNNGTQEAHKEIESLTQNGFHNTAADGEDSSLHELSELEEDLENKTPSQKLNFSSEEESNREPSNINESLKKNKTMKRTLQTRLGIETTVGGASGLNLGVGGAASTTGPSSSAPNATGMDQEIGAGMGLNSEQPTATRPSITAISQTDMSTGAQEGSSTSNNSNPDLWPTAQDSLNTNAAGNMQIRQHQSRPSTANYSSSNTMYSWPTYQSNFITNPFADNTTQNNYQQTGPSTIVGNQVGIIDNQYRPAAAIDSSVSSSVNHWAKIQENINKNALTSGVIQNYQQQSRPIVATGSQIGIANQIGRPSAAMNSSAFSTFNQWPTSQSNINTNTFSGSTIQNNQQQRPSIVAGSQFGPTTYQNIPSSTIDSSASATTSNLPTLQSNWNTNTYAGGAIQNNQQQTTPSVSTAGQAGVTKTHIRPSATMNSSASSSISNWSTSQGSLNANPFAISDIYTNQQKNTPSIVAESQVGVTTNQNKSSTGLNASAYSDVNDWPSSQYNFNTNAFADSTTQTNQQQTIPSGSIVSQAGVTTNTNRPSTTINSSAFPTLNNWPTSQSNFNTNVSAGVSTQNNKHQSRPSLTAGSQVNRPFTASNADAKLTANKWQTVNSGINTNAFAGGGIQNNAQQSVPSMATVSHAGVTTNHYSPSTKINATASSVNKWQSMLGGLNSNSFAGETIQTNEQPSSQSLTAGSQVQVTAINQNRPSAGSNTNAKPTANNWMTVNGVINTNTLDGGGIQNYQPETRPSQTVTANSEVGISNQYMSSTAHGSSTTLPIQQAAVGYNGQTSSLTSTSNNSATSHQSQSKPLEPLTKISQLMKVMEVISNDSSANIPGPLGGDEANVKMNFAQGSNLKQSSVTAGQDATKLNLQYNNVQPTNYSKRSLGDLTKIVQLLKVIEVISNATSEEDPKFHPEQNTERDIENPVLITYDVDAAMNSGSYLDNGLSITTQGNVNSDIALTSRPTSGLPNYQNSYNQVSHKNQLTASAGLNVMGTTNNLYKQFSPEHPTSSTAANINYNNVVSSEQVLSQGISASAGQDYLAASGNSQAAIFASPPTSGIKRRSLTSLIQTVNLLDAIKTLVNINDTDQKGNTNSELLTSNTNQPAALQNGATISNNFNSNAVEQINAGFYSPQEVAQGNYIDQRPSLTAKGEATQYAETDVNLSNMAEIKPTTTTNNQQNFRPTLSLENSKDRGSESVIPNYQQQTLMAGEAQAGIGNQYRPGSATLNPEIMTNNIPTTQKDYNYNMNGFTGSDQYNVQQMRPSIIAGSQTGLVSQNQYRPNAGISTNADTTLNNVATIQGGFNMNDISGSNQYREQQVRPSVAEENQTGLSSEQYNPYVASNTSAVTTINNTQTVQGSVNMNSQVNSDQYDQQTIRPLSAVGGQAVFVNNNQYRPLAVTNSNAQTITNNVLAKQDGYAGSHQKVSQLSGQSSDVGYETFTNNSNSALNSTATITVGNFLSVLGDLNQNTLHQNNMQTRPSVATGTLSTLSNNNLYRPTPATTTNGPNMTNKFATIGEGKQTGLVNNYQYIPNGVSNTSAENDSMDSNLYKEQQIVPSVAAGNQIGLDSNSLYRTNLSSNIGTLNMVQNGDNQYRPNIALIINAATSAGEINVNNDFSGNNLNDANQQIEAGDKTGSINYNQYRPSEGFNENAPTMISNNPTTQGDYDMNGVANQYGEQQLGTFAKAESQSGIINNNQYRLSASINGSTQNVANNFPAEYNDTNLNQYNDQQMRPTVGSPIALINNPDRQNATWNTEALTTANKIPTAQGAEINMNDYGGINQYNGLNIRPSVATGNQKGFVNTNQSAHNTALNGNGRYPLSVNNMTTPQGELNMNDYGGIVQSFTFRPLVANGSQTGVVSSQSMPNAAVNENVLTTISNLPTVSGVMNMNYYTGVNQYNQQSTPSVATETPTGFGNNQYSLNAPSATTANNSLTIQGGTNENNQFQIIPLAPAGAQGGKINNQSTPNAAFNLTTTNKLPTTQSGIKINIFGKINQYNQQKIKPSVGAGTQTGFGSNNQYRPNAALNTSATATVNYPSTLQDDIKQNGLGSYNPQQMSPSVAVGTQTGLSSNDQYKPNTASNTSATAGANYTPAMQDNIKTSLNQYNEQEIRPTLAAGNQAGILNNNQRLSFGLNTTGNTEGVVKDGLKVNQSIAANQIIMQLNGPSVAMESQGGFGSKAHSKPNSVINTNATTNFKGTPAAGNQNHQQNQTSVKPESQVDLNTTSINNTPQMTQINANSKDDNLNQTSSLRSEVSMNDEKQNTDIKNQEGSLQAKSSSTATLGKQIIPLKTVETKENSGINLNHQHTKESNTAETHVGSVSTSNQEIPYAPVNLSSSTPINNVLIPLDNPDVNTYVTNQIQPLAQVPVIMNNPTLISESNLYTSSFNSKLIQELSQNRTSDITRNQLIHSTPTILGQLVPGTTGLLNNSQPTGDPLINGGSSEVNAGNQIISSGKENNTSTSMNNNQKIAINTSSTGLNVEEGISVTNTKEDNGTDKEENSQSLASDVQGGISSSHHSNSSTANDSKTSGSTETQSKESEESKSKIQVQGNNDVGNNKISANNITKEHETTEESQNQKHDTSTAEKSHIITNFIPSIASGSISHVDCIKKEPLRNGSMSITNVGDCIMHQNHGNGHQVENMQVSGAASSSSVINATLNSSVGGSLEVNAIANSKNETNNIVTASSNASFLATNTAKAQVAIPSGVASPQAISNLQNPSQT